MSEEEPLSGKVALVTGGSKGIGLAAAKALAGAGASVIIAGRNMATLGQAMEVIGTRATVLKTDVTDQVSCQRLRNWVEQRIGRLDLCVCSAGVGFYGEVVDFPAEAWRETMATNVDGVFYTVQAVLPLMLRQGSGHIITIASTYAHKGVTGFAAYCASKYAVRGFSTTLAMEVRPKGIKVTVVSPGTVDTNFRDRQTNRPRTGLLAHPERMLTAADVASAILWAATTSPTAVPDEILLDPAQWW